MTNLTQTQVKAQATRLLAAVRRLRGSPAYNMELEQCRNRRAAFIAEMVGGAPTNSMGTSSIVHGTGGLDLTDLPLLPTRKRRKRLRELVGSTTPNNVEPSSPIVTPKRNPRAKKATPIIVNPKLYP
jgi:hypothetical protein